MMLNRNQYRKSSRARGAGARVAVVAMLLPVSLLLPQLAAGAQAQDTRAASASAAAPVSIVELFTSQGCNDCPPADALLGEFGRHPGIIALAYHVTYWDELGWHDRFELPEADARQQYYVKQLRLPVAFTPQAVVNGRISLIGSDRQGIATQLAMQHASIPVTLALSHGQVRIALDSQVLTAPLNVILVGSLPQAVTAVGAGENAGRKLEEFDIVRAYRVLGAWRGKAREFALPLASLPADVKRVAVLLQEPGGTIAGAAALEVR